MTLVFLHGAEVGPSREALEITVRQNLGIVQVLESDGTLTGRRRAAHDRCFERRIQRIDMESLSSHRERFTMCVVKVSSLLVREKECLLRQPPLTG